jgi:hypothetical protein
MGGREGGGGVGRHGIWPGNERRRSMRWGTMAEFVTFIMRDCMG